MPTAEVDCPECRKRPRPRGKSKSVCGGVLDVCPQGKELVEQGADRGDNNSYDHVAAELELEDYEKELAFLPDVREPAETKLDLSAKNAQNPELSTEQQARMVAFKQDLNECDRRHDNPSEVNEATQTSLDDANEESREPLATPNAEDIDPVAVQNERRRRIAKAQEEELKWANLKAILRRNSAKLGYKAARDAWKVMDQFVLSEDGVLYCEGRSRRKRNDEQAEITLRLVVPTTMIQDVLQTCHDSLEGGHQGVVRTYQRTKLDYFWIGLYADVEKHVRSCPDCSSSKSRPHLRGYSPGNILAEMPFQQVSMDFVIPLPITRRGNTALLQFQCSFTGFVIAKAMSNTVALRVAQAFEECVYRRFGAPSLIIHDRDPRFMSEVFQEFAEMMQSKSRATLRFRPQANGQQQRSVKTVIQSVRVYAEDPLQQDWDEIVERLVFAINNSMDTTRKETPFYFIHGWDARSTLRAMTSSLRRGNAKLSDALAWRREINRQHEIALEMAKEYQATEKDRRAKEHNESEPAGMCYDNSKQPQGLTGRTSRNHR
ncbi:unnamed protein product [Phytophthora fragariaefolia]|uniref:Unnamed protein product n=1 Tax=Phytophthora fragariaefolia TaxID=1490495 RepID=A0A9W6Y8R5_9STRA|nr:unnamed protein product [Phytophthora fragariaefolia]